MVCRFALTDIIFRDHSLRKCLKGLFKYGANTTPSMKPAKSGMKLLSSRAKAALRDFWNIFTKTFKGLHYRNKPPTTQPLAVSYSPSAGSTDTLKLSIS